MGRNAADRDAWLLAAVAENHRHWFRARGGGGGIWSLGRNDELGVRLVARGYEWGWRPHWMGVDSGKGGDGTGGGEQFHRRRARRAPVRQDPPLTAMRASSPPEAIHLGVRLREKVIGQVVILPLDGVAGIYSMGVAPKAQGRGIGLALTKAALRVAWEQDCHAAVLNATADGERLYARARLPFSGMGPDLVAIGRSAPDRAPGRDHRGGRLRRRQSIGVPRPHRIRGGLHPAPTRRRHRPGTIGGVAPDPLPVRVPLRALPTPRRQPPPRSGRARPARGARDGPAPGRRLRGAGCELRRHCRGVGRASRAGLTAFRCSLCRTCRHKEQLTWGAAETLLSRPPRQSEMRSWASHRGPGWL